MVELAQDMDRIATGLWHEDYDLIEEGARSIAQHPKIPPRQIAKIKKALGPKFEGFVSMDRSVHQTATRLVKAAQARNWSKVLGTHERLKRGCTSCHATYREDLRPVLNP
jgi:cytochrome c556